MRSAWFVVGLALRRLRRRDSGALVTVLGLAVATAALAGVLAGVTIATDRSLAQAIERIPSSARSVRAVWFGVPGDASERLSVLDGEVDDAFRTIGLDGPTPLALFRESTVAGRYVGITAVDGLAPYVILRSGRLPRTCTPRRCEVLRLRGRAGRLPNAEGLRLVEVGTGTLRSRQLYGDFLRSTDAAVADATILPELGQTSEYHRPAPAPLVVAEGRDALASSAALERTYRTYAWVWPIDPGSPRLWEVDDLLARAERARVELAAVSSFDVAAPVEELRAAQRAADVAGSRLLLVGGEAAALLLAFTVLAARGLRRDLMAARRRLTWSGARRWQLVLLSGVESAFVAVAGVLAGWALGIAIAAVAARIAGAPVEAVLRESVLSSRGLALAAASMVAAAAVVWITVSLQPREGARLGVLDLVAAGALVVTLVALAGGVADEDRLARGESSALLLLLLPGLVAVAAAIFVARTFPVVARWWSDRAWGGVAARLAAVGLGRGPGAAVATVSFLTIAFALALLAEGYRATLVRGDREQAAFRVPHDVTAREDLGNLVRVFDAAPLGRFRELVGEDGSAHPVLRVNAGAGRAERVSGVTVLGLDRDAITGVGVWRPEWASGRDLESLAADVDPGRPVELQGLPLDDGEIVLRVPAGIVSYATVVRLPDGSFRRVELGEADPERATTLSVRVPRGSLLTRFEIVPPPRLIERGSDAGNAFVGTIPLSGPLARDVRDWIGQGGVETTPTPDGFDADVTLTLGRLTYLRAPQATDSAPPKVFVTPRLAELAGGVGGVLPLQVAGETVQVEVAGTIERFPGSQGDTVVGDRVALATAINTVAPGSARENEVWLDVAPERAATVAASLARPPFRALDTTVRTDVEDEARSDPLARGTLGALIGGAIVALVLAALGLALAVRADLRDDRGESYDLEAQGSSPAFLRRVVRARAATLSLVGLAAGMVTGLGLLAFVTRLVSVTTGGAVADPPLAVVVHPLVIAIGVALYAILAFLLVGGATQRAFAGSRGPVYRETDA